MLESTLFRKLFKVKFFSIVIELNGKHLSFSATERSALLSFDCPIKEQVLCKGINSL